MISIDRLLRTVEETKTWKSTRTSIELQADGEHETINDPVCSTQLHPVLRGFGIFDFVHHRVWDANGRPLQGLLSAFVLGLAGPHHHHHGCRVLNECRHCSPLGRHNEMHGAPR